MPPLGAVLAFAVRPTGQVSLQQVPAVDERYRHSVQPLGQVAASPHAQLAPARRVTMENGRRTGESLACFGTCAVPAGQQPRAAWQPIRLAAGVLDIPVHDNSEAQQAMPDLRDITTLLRSGAEAGRRSEVLAGSTEEVPERSSAGQGPPLASRSWIPAAQLAARSQAS